MVFFFHFELYSAYIDKISDSCGFSQKITRGSQEPVIAHLVFNLTSADIFGHLMKFLLIVMPAILNGG